jgi:hypothetical protein
MICRNLESSSVPSLAPLGNIPNEFEGTLSVQGPVRALFRESAHSDISLRMICRNLESASVPSLGPLGNILTEFGGTLSAQGAVRAL